MPATRRSMGVNKTAPNALQPVDDNLVPPPPTAVKKNTATVNTPGKQVKALKAELDKKDAENKALMNTIAELTNAVNGMTLVASKAEKTIFPVATAAANNVADEEATAVTDGEGKKAPRAKKDKNAPVPAMTAYKYFCELHKLPKPKKGAAPVDMRQLWKDCDPATRAKYTAMADVDKARYNKEFKQYEEEKFALEMYYDKKKQDLAMEFFTAHMMAQAAKEKAEAETKKGKKKTKDPEAPKRPVSSYMYFAMDKRESVTKMNPDATPVEVSKALGELWQKCVEQKGTAEYDGKAAKDKTRYEAEKAKYDALIAERKAQAEHEKEESLKQDKEEAMKLMQSFHDASTIVTANAAAMNAKQAKAKPHLMPCDEISAITEPSLKKEKKKKDPNAPKKAFSAYLFFCNENRDKIKAKMPEGTGQKELLTEMGRQWKEMNDKKKAKYNKMADKDKERYSKEMEKYTAEKK